MIEPREETSGALRVGVLGPFQIAFFVISAAGPLIAMAGGIPVAMLFGDGAGLPALFVIASLILLAFASGYTAMARRIRNAGAFYAFAAQGLGGRAAGATGMVALLAYNAIQIGIYGLFGAAVAGLLAPVGMILPWWVCSLTALAAVAALGYRQIDLSARILGGLVALEYLSVLTLDVAVVASGGASGISLASFTPVEVFGGSPAIGLLLSFSAFIGFEATTIYSEEARDPQRTIPLATYLSVILIGGFYTLSTWAMVVGVGPERVMPVLTKSDPTTLLFSLADRFVGHWLTDVMRLLFVTSAFAALLAFHNSIARYQYAMGREGLLASALARVHPRHRSPWISSFVQSATALGPVILFAAAGADPVLVTFTVGSAVGTLGIIVLMAIVSLAAMRFLAGVEGEGVARGLSTISFVAFVGIALLAVTRFDVLAGTGNAAIRSLPALVAAAAVGGVLLAERLRRRSPMAFRSLGMSRE